MSRLVSVSPETRGSVVVKKTWAPSARGPDERRVECAVSVDDARRDSGRGAAEPLVHVLRTVRVPCGQRLRGREEDVQAVGGNPLEDRRNRTVSVDRANGDLRRGRAEALIDVDAEVGIRGGQLLVGREEDPAAIRRGAGEAGVVPEVAVDRADRDPGRRRSRALVDVDLAVGVVAGELVGRREEGLRAVARDAAERGIGRRDRPGRGGKCQIRDDRKDDRQAATGKQAAFSELPPHAVPSLVSPPWCLRTLPECRTQRKARRGEQPGTITQGRRATWSPRTALPEAGRAREGRTDALVPGVVRGIGRLQIGGHARCIDRAQGVSQ